MPLSAFMVDESLAALRALARQRQRAVNNKISRLRKNDVEVGGTKHDPRRDLSKLKNYNRVQLQSYIDKLNAFTNRKTAFVPDTFGQPIPKAKWQAYKAKETEYNKKIEVRNSSIDNIKIPTTNVTIGERRKEMLARRNRRARGKGSAVSNVFTPIERDSRNATGERAVDKFNQALKKMLTPQYFKREIKRARKELNQMLTDIGAVHLIERANKLTDEQFQIVWNDSEFATVVSLEYEQAKKSTDSYEDKVLASQTNGNIQDAEELIEWGLSIKTRDAKKA